jgi:tubulin alpha
LVNGKEDAANNYMRGQFMFSGLLNLALDRIRLLANDCESLEGFIIYHAIGGGTGSGLADLLL